MSLSNRMMNVLTKPQRRIIGLMSGMSMDGIDLADVFCSGQYPHFGIQFIGSHYLPYSIDLKKRLIAARDGNVADIAELNFLVAEEFAQCVQSYFCQHNIPLSDIDAIGSHGQTVFHSTSGTRHSTLQLASPSLIAEKTGLLTVGNFRLRDIAVGGQGAPFVPLADFVFHRDDAKPLLLVNLGSIANVTLLMPRFEDIFACDVGPANMPIDFFMTQLSGTALFDENGVFSAKGHIIEPLLNQLLALPFFEKQPPKAAGYNEFGPTVLSAILAPYLTHPLHDLIRTAVEFSAQTLVTGVRQYVLPRAPQLKEVRVSGGGIYNKTLMSRLNELMPQLAITPLSKQIADAKEAVAFALLAHATLNGEPGNLPQATGARKKVVLGEIAF